MDLTEGMFRHLVITGRSRLALYLARIPAALAIIVPLVALGFTIVCAICVFAAPSRLSFTGVAVPAGLSRSGLQSWAADHPAEVLCNFDYNGQQGRLSAATTHPASHPGSSSPDPIDGRSRPPLHRPEPPRSRLPSRTIRITESSSATPRTP